MKLSEKQKDALSEVINISFSRAAKSLNELTENRVVITVPRIELVEIENLEKALQGYITGDVTSINQIFSGPIKGNACLIFDKEGSIDLVKIILKEENLKDDLSESTKEVIIEIGNIILSAFLSMFGNLLKVNLRFSVPTISLDSLSNMIETFEFEDTVIKYAMIIFMEFTLEQTDIKGFLVVIMGINSLEKFLDEIDKLG